MDGAEINYKARATLSDWSLLATMLCCKAREVIPEENDCTVYGVQTTSSSGETE